MSIVYLLLLHVIYLISGIWLIFSLFAVSFLSVSYSLYVSCLYVYCLWTRCLMSPWSMTVFFLLYLHCWLSYQSAISMSVLADCLVSVCFFYCNCLLVHLLSVCCLSNVYLLFAFCLFVYCLSPWCLFILRVLSVVYMLSVYLLFVFCLPVSLFACLSKLYYNREFKSFIIR